MNSQRKVTGEADRETGRYGERLRRVPDRCAITPPVTFPADGECLAIADADTPQINRLEDRNKGFVDVMLRLRTRKPRPATEMLIGVFRVIPIGAEA
ncbi:hypothetical protein KZX46_13115 [Polymorphobacter sp. PAMC 29334]|uniref:hypothetical protein n=1 Tax=Polymorphobacter sp. PAMC 29334 TaxID=2862331 RepID=UPI001C78CB98|nr:hypothetical protein [Polymorphobacter sp. PAMC 29334]QYE33777.1 hypothetical protein KZX46_13115 [Polymorphobacter sp. PAMC 29334]